MTRRPPAFLLAFLLLLPGLARAEERPVGDLAPGSLDWSTTPPTHFVTGDGAVNVADVIVLLRAAVGLQRLALAPEPCEYRLTPWLTDGALDHAVTDRDCSCNVSAPLSIDVEALGGITPATFQVTGYAVTFRRLDPMGGEVAGVDVPEPVIGTLPLEPMVPPFRMDLGRALLLPEDAKAEPPLNDDDYFAAGAASLEATITFVGHPLDEPDAPCTGSVTLLLEVRASGDPARPGCDVELDLEGQADDGWPPFVGIHSVLPELACASGGTILSVHGHGLVGPPPLQLPPAIRLNGRTARVIETGRNVPPGGTEELDVLRAVSDPDDSPLPPSGLFVRLDVETATAVRTLPNALKLLPSCRQAPTVSFSTPAEGPAVGGTEVRVFGSDVACVTEVRLTGLTTGRVITPRIFYPVSDTELVLETAPRPPLPNETYDLLLESDCGSAELPAAWTYADPP